MLVKVTYEGGRYAGNNQPSTYCLTFYAGRDAGPATNEWKGKTKEAIKEWKRAWKIRLIEDSNPRWRDLYEELS